MTNKSASSAIKGSLFIAALALAACGGSDDFVSNQQSSIDGGIKVNGKPASDSNPNNSSNAGKYPFASGDFNNCSNAEAHGACTIPNIDSDNGTILSLRDSGAFQYSTAFFDRFFIVDNGQVRYRDDWFNVIPYDKSLRLPSFNQDTDKQYSYEYPNNTFDGLTNAVREAIVNGINKNNEKYIDFSSLKGYFAGNDLVLVRDVDAWGFQTIGQKIKFNSKKQIVNDTFFTVGQPLTEINGLNEATYHGIATGSLNGRSDTFAEVTAELKLPATGIPKLMLNISNTQITPNNLTSMGFTGSKPAPELDFSRTMQWNNNTAEFTNNANGTVTANIYGPEGQEVGGTFSGTTQDYQGAFGAKR